MEHNDNTRAAAEMLNTTTSCSCANAAAPSDGQLLLDGERLEKQDSKMLAVIRHATRSHLPPYLSGPSTCSTAVTEPVDATSVVKWYMWQKMTQASNRRPLHVLQRLQLGRFLPSSGNTSGIDTSGMNLSGIDFAQDKRHWLEWLFGSLGFSSEVRDVRSKY
ncbi:unnamed protein product [Amoebophrya sp. A25]|nr:unnamed protein product [Amoebophrya sp. A25]|eukprot:GSA25T00023371001.1